MIAITLIVISHTSSRAPWMAVLVCWATILIQIDNMSQYLLDGLLWNLVQMFKSTSGLFCNDVGDQFNISSSAIIVPN